MRRSVLFRPLSIAPLLALLPSIAQAQLTSTASVAPAVTSSTAVPALVAPAVTVAPVVVLEEKPREISSAPFDEEPETVRQLLAGKDLSGTPAGPTADAPLPPPSAPPGETRPEPEFDGREAAPTTAGEALLWVPRVILFPVKLTFDYLVRWPIVGGLTLAEEYHLFDRIERLLTWRDGRSGVFPNFLADFGLNPSVGISTFHNELFVPNNSLSASASFWDERWIRVAGRNQTTVFDDDSGRITLFGEYLTRPDLPFYGVGPLTSTDDEGNYRMERYGGGFELRAALTGLNRISYAAEFRHTDLTDDGQAPRISTIDYGPRGIPGFDQKSYELIENRLKLELDTRHPDTEFHGGSGARFEFFGSFDFDPSDPSRNFFRWGGEGSVFLDLSGVSHILALSVHTEFVENSGGDPIPFTELAALGGTETMRGYLPRRFVGESAFAATLSYRYPVWSLLDAELFASLGNVFDGHLKGIRPSRMYLNSGLGLRTNLDRETAFTILIAVGTNRLDEEDVYVDSVRFTFGLVQGF